jgi:FkbM family methyltransferase
MLNQFIVAESDRLGIAQNLIETRIPETYSQAGEDIIVQGLLFALLPRLAPVQRIYYLDIGANHPIQTSNTYLLYKALNAQGVLFDADPELIPSLQKVRSRDTVVCTAVSASSNATVTLNVSNARELSSLDINHVRAFAGMGEVARIVKQVNVPNLHIGDLLAKYGQQSIQYLSIDVEGEDLSIMKAIDFDRYRPWILSCEPSAQVYPENPQLMYQVMAQAGYCLVANTGINMIFVDKRWL